MVSINYELPAELHRQLKIRAAEEGVTLKDLIVRYLEEGPHGRAGRMDDRSISAAEFDVHPAAKGYYERTTLDLAIQATRERIEEWSYEADPHGYCHERALLVALLSALEGAPDA